MIDVYEAPWGNGWGLYTHRILPRFYLCHPTGLLDVFPLRQNAYPTPKWVRSGAVAGDAQHCSRHDVDPGRGSGSLREASVGSSSVPQVYTLPFGAPMPRTGAGMDLVFSRRRRTFEKSGRGTVLGFLPVRG